MFKAICNFVQSLGRGIKKVFNVSAKELDNLSKDTPIEKIDIFQSEMKKSMEKLLETHVNTKALYNQRKKKLNEMEKDADNKYKAAVKAVDAGEDDDAAALLSSHKIMKEKIHVQEDLVNELKSHADETLEQYEETKAKYDQLELTKELAETRLEAAEVKSQLYSVDSKISDKALEEINQEINMIIDKVDIKTTLDKEDKKIEKIEEKYLDTTDDVSIQEEINKIKNRNK